MSTTVVNPVALLQTPLVDIETGLIVRNQYPFFTETQKLLASSYQPIFDVSTFGAQSDGRGDAAPGITAAYRAAIASGGGVIYLGPGTYNIASPVLLTGTVPVIFLGSGRATKLLRTGTMPQGNGMFDLSGATDITFENFLVDGNVLQSVGVNYSQINGDPRNPILTQNTSFWVHDSSADINFSNIAITHTGGYSVLVDAVSSDVTDINFWKLRLENNRPHLFGTDDTDLSFGSWTGGVLLHANGIDAQHRATVKRVQFVSCSAHRVTGNAFWAGHLYGFSTMFEEITFDDITGIDCGRDLIQLGATLGTRINGVTGRRIGYITKTDTDAPVPKWQSGEWAVGIDCGPCFNTTIDNINLTSVNGGCFDLDGMLYTTLSNFTARVPLPGEPEYDEDRIGSLGWAGSTVPGGPNAAYGILMAPSGYGPFGEGHHTVGEGTLINFSAGAVRMYGTMNNKVSKLNILHPAVNNGAPIQLGNVSAAVRSAGNCITDNRIEYDPTAPAPCISEIGGAGPFQATDVNQVLGNQVVSGTGATEFAKDPASGSIGSLTQQIDFSTFTGKLTLTSGYATKAV